MCARSNIETFFSKSLRHVQRTATHYARELSRAYRCVTFSEMAAPGARMRLTVEVLPLTADNVHGPFRAQAMAAFKGRKFALPVQLEDTFEQVWAKIEQRYKHNYLDAQQAA